MGDRAVVGSGGGLGLHSSGHFAGRALARAAAVGDAAARWMVITITCALAIVCWRPKALLFALPVLVLLAVMRPRSRSRSSRG